MIAIAAGCPGSATPGPPRVVGGMTPVEPEIEPDTRPVPIIDVRRVEIQLRGITGLSDLARDDAGRLWAVAERNRFLIRMAPDGTKPVKVRVVGIPEPLDVEGLAWLPDGRVALATESTDAGRTSEAMFFARVRGRRVVVEERRELDYSL